jgi:hypothetical protein
MRKLVLTVLPVLVLAFSAGSLTGCKNKWVKKAEDIEKAACACKDAKCAKEQQKALNTYIKDTKGVKVKKKDANKVAKLVLKASTCISKIQIKAMRDKLKKKK